MRLHIKLFAAFALTAIAATGCGGQGSAGGSLDTQPSATAPSVELAAKLPGVPADERLNLYRMAASATAVTQGADFNRASDGLASAGLEAVLASGADSVAYALYRFGAVPGETIESLGYRLNSLDTGEKVYAAIANYTTGRWDYFPEQAASDVTLNIEDSINYLSASGNIWLLLITYGGDSANVEEVRISFAERFNVSGQVLDKNGMGVEGVLITSPLGGVATRTNNSGAYFLGGMPNGTWPLAATLDGWTFYSQPTLVTVAGADAVAPDMLGDSHGARFEDYDIAPNDYFGADSPVWDTASPLEESVSVDDDPLDIYRFTVEANGTYLLQYSNPDQSILFPVVAVLEGSAVSQLDSTTIISGDVGVAFTVNDAPREFHAAVLAQAGGGRYSLELLESPSALMGVTVDGPGAAEIGGGVATLVRSDNSRATQYFATAFAPGFGNVILDPAVRPGGEGTMSVAMSDFDVLPASLTLTLDAATPASYAFIATQVASGDSMEPNDDNAGATVIAAIPYDNPTPLSVRADMDIQDVFRITPAAGANVRVFIDFDTLGGTFHPIRATLTDLASFPRGHVWQTADGLMLELSEQADGGNYYIHVLPEAMTNREATYTLRVRNYSAGATRFATRVLPSKLIDGASFSVYDETFAARLQVGNSTADSLSTPIYKEAGTRLRVDCYRYGTAHDRQTQLVTTAAGDTTVYFDAPDMGSDAHEPNSSFGLTLSELDLPVTVEASLGLLTDNVDIYRLSPADGKPFRVTLSTSSPGTLAELLLFDNIGNLQASARLSGPAATVYLPNNGTFGQKLQIIQARLAAFTYTLEVDTGEAYQVSGLIRDTGMTNIRGRVCNLTTGDITFPELGPYAFGTLLPPGSYTLEATAAGYTPLADTRNIVVTNADVVLDFDDFVAGAADPYEPNETAAAATAMLPDSDYIAFETIGQDYFALPLAPGQRARVTLTPSNPWNDRLFLARESSFTTDLFPAVGGGGNVRYVDFTGDFSNKLVLRVTGFGRYTLRAELQP